MSIVTILFSSGLTIPIASFQASLLLQRSRICIE